MKNFLLTVFGGCFSAFLEKGGAAVSYQHTVAQREGRMLDIGLGDLIEDRE